MSKVFDGLLYGLGGTLGALTAVQIAEDLCPFMNWLNWYFS